MKVFQTRTHILDLNKTSSSSSDLQVINQSNAQESVAYDSCVGTAGTLGTAGTFGGTAGSFGTAGTYACG